MTLDVLDENSLFLAAEDCDPSEFEKIHKFSSFERKIIRSLIAHGPLLLRGGRGSGKSALLIEADRQIKAEWSNVLSVYVSLRHLPLLRSEGKVYESIFCELLLTALNDELERLDLPCVDNRPSDAGQLRQMLVSLGGRINRRVVLIFDDAAHIGRENALTEFFDIFRTISSNVVSCKAAIYPGVTRFGIRFDVFNDATVIDVARDERSGEFSSFFAEVMQARFPTLSKKLEKSRGRSLGLETTASLIGRTVVGNMRAFVFACSWLSASAKIGLPDVKDILLRLASDYYWPLLDEVAPKLGPYEVLIEPCRNVAEVIFRHAASTDSGSAIVHREIVQKLGKLFEILEYVGFISRREASRSMKSGGRGPRYSLNLANLLETRPKAQLTFDLVDIWLNTSVDSVEFHASGNQIPLNLPEIDPTQELAVFNLPIQSLAKGKTYVYGLTTRQINLLLENGYKTIKDVANESDENLHDLEGIGDKTLLRIRNVISQAIWM
ncbi:helix-hairpin-helix domain-containing protein [Burkholderia latens]|uniref:RNA polymerase alpha subunit C-terminal domain-containing protein n=1 Tax=Burkholderia latens TaxID=488446 RepID=A0A6H9SVV8_9BURK|nr:helix-hairpin-helix domain-containing protein [Burkholderia latens]KAB0643841.1 hypothetical protein F7R21_05510 [Burkholderia latens]VWB47263.1 hypothetical protein BLA24064_02132 [Burkholderia latens]